VLTVLVVKFRAKKSSKPKKAKKSLKPGKFKILVTSALPYANGPIHIGHLVEYIQTDIFVRFLKLIGEDAIYICADDTHGAPIEIKASELKIKPEELIEKYYKEHTKDFKDFLIEFDNYYSTNSPENKHYSDIIFNAAKKKGLICKKTIRQAYDPEAGRFLPDRYVKGKCPKCGAEDQYGDVCEACGSTHTTEQIINPYSAVTKKPIEFRESEHYFFKLSAMSKKLEKWLKSNKNLQEEVKNFVLNWIKEGLQDWCISRDGPYFGFKIPGEENKFYYVWLDAPVGYIASTENYCKKHNLKTEHYWKGRGAKIHHFIGKDITYFHFLFWPAMLMTAGFNTPYAIKVHGFLTVNGEKMSKSRGTFFTAREFLQKHRPEHLRYYYASMLSSRLSDINMDFEELKHKVNNELVANIGNFCYRIISFTNKNFNGEIKDIDKNQQLIKEINNKIRNIEKNYHELNYNEAVKEILHISSIGNKYFQDNEPWKLIKEDLEKAHKICGLGANIAKILSILISPILPNISKELQSQLSLKELVWKDLEFNLKNHKISGEKILIEKIEEPKQEEFPLDLRVARIIEVNDHPNADKLYVLQIDLGAEKRQLVAGLKGHYSKEELKGKKIVVITNLKYAKLRGIESQGMLLAGDDGENVGVLTVEKSEAGSHVYPEGFSISKSQLAFDDFLKLEIKASSHKAVFKGKELKTDKETVLVEKAKDGARIR